MAKVKGLHQSPRAPSMRRAVIYRPHHDGHVAASWPKKRSGPLSQKQKDAIATFKEAAIVAKYAPAADQMRSRELAHGSQFLPRDLQYMAIFGRLCTLFFTNGERRYQLASRYDLTELLDILGFQPGTLLMRGAEFWEPLLPGPEGAPLTIVDGKPEWGGGSAGGASGGFDGMTLNGPIGANLSGSGATKAQLIRPRTNVTITALSGFVDTSNPATRMAVTLARASDFTEDAEVTEVIYSGPSFDIGTTARTYFSFDLEVPRDLEAGVPYLFAIRRTDGTDTFPNEWQGMNWATGAGAFNAPIDLFPLTLSFISRDLSIGQQADSSSNNIILLWPSGYLTPA